MTEGWRPAHRRGRGKYPLRGNLHTRWGGGGVTEGPARKREGRLPTEGEPAQKRGDNPAQKALEVCKQRKRHTCQTKEMTRLHKKGGKDLNKGNNLQWREGPEQRETTYTGDAKSLHTEGESRSKNLQTAGGVHTYTKH